MDDRFNTIAGWVLAAGIVALGSSIASGIYFEAEAPEKPGYAVADAEPAAGEGGAAALTPAGVIMATADVAAGAEVFKKCASCHSINQGGANGIGPNLWGIMGKPIAAAPGFAYSDALKGKGGNWGWDEMNAWIASPRKFAPGTKMTFAGIGDDKDRADVLAYMNAQGSNLPLPPPPAAGAAAGAPAENAAAPADNAANAAEPADNAANAEEPAANAANAANAAQ